MACDRASSLVPSAHSTMNTVSMECFTGQHLDDAVNCLHKFSLLQRKGDITSLLSSYSAVHPQVRLDMLVNNVQ